jgi:hypothetical protein
MAINEIAGHIKSIDDAHKLVDLIAAEFSDGPPKWATPSMRDRIASAEYAAAADPGSLISEQRVADAWNAYLQETSAPQEYFVTADEIHTLRDSLYTTSQVIWAGGGQSVWGLSKTYAVGADGKIANGCRALEALRVLWQLAWEPEVLQGTRDLLKKGQRMSDFFEDPSKTGPGTVSFTQAPPNPVREAGGRYRQDHGARALNNAIERLLKDLFEG